MPAIRSCCRDSRGAAAFLVVMLALAAPADAAEFPVSGTITVNDTPAALPTGGTFGDSSYDGSSGAISAGRFTLPTGTVSFDSPLGPVVATYELSQTNTSTGDVAHDGVAALTPAAMKLQVVSALAGGFFPIDVGICIFQPIDLILVGVGSAAGLDLSDPAFVIPPVAPGDCAGYGDQINAAVAGSLNAIDLHLAGDFTPPGDNDTIFRNGFDVP